MGWASVLTPDPDQLVLIMDGPSGAGLRTDKFRPLV